MASGHDFAFVVAFLVLSVTDFVGNFLVCMIILQRKRFRFRRSTLDFLFLNLAVADLLVAVFAIPRYVLPDHVFPHPRGFTGDILCRFITGGNLMWTAGAASVFSLVTIAFERRQVVSRPYVFNQKFSRTKLRLLVPMSWTFALLLNLPLFFIMSYDEKTDFCVENWPNRLLPKLYGVLWFTVVGVLPTFLMGILYSKVMYQLWVKRSRTIEVNRRAILLPRRKVTKMAITLTVIYSICWLPNLILSVRLAAVQVVSGAHMFEFYRKSLCLHSSESSLQSVSKTGLNVQIRASMHWL